MKRYIRFYASTDAFRNSVRFNYVTEEAALKIYKNSDLLDSLRAFLESSPMPGEFIELGGTIIMRPMEPPYGGVPEDGDDLFEFNLEFKDGMG